MKVKKALILLLCIASAAILFIIGKSADIYSLSASTEELGKNLGIYSAVPALFAVLLAFLSGNVVVALLAGLVYGQIVISLCSGYTYGEMLGKVIEFTAGEITGTATETGNAQVLILCALIGGFTGVLKFSGGFEAAASKLAQKINTPRKANLIGQMFCMLFFFDDYANALISGPVLQPVMKKAKVSHERLAYIVDSTAAPVAGIAVVSSWVAVEISIISKGLQTAGIDVSAFTLFLQSVKYCFYCIFAIIFVFLTSVMGREYGPMLKFEREQRNCQDDNDRTVCEKNTDGKDTIRIVVVFLSIAVLILYSIINIVVMGGNTIEILINAALLCSILAIICGCVASLFNIADAVDAFLNGASSMMPTIIVLILAWSLASVIEKLGTVYYIVGIIANSVPWQLIPALIFISCCVISFAAGSYGCMFVAMPMAIPIANTIISSGTVPIDERYLLICVAAVLCGGIFGDHCSPMTDCNILAAMGSGCKVMNHVKTQLPYTLTVSSVAILCIFLTTIGANAYAAIALGTVLLFAVIRIFGEKP